MLRFLHRQDAVKLLTAAGIVNLIVAIVIPHPVLVLTLAVVNFLWLAAFWIRYPKGWLYNVVVIALYVLFNVCRRLFWSDLSLF
jgi:hypothetical protein